MKKLLTPAPPEAAYPKGEYSAASSGGVCQPRRDRERAKRTNSTGQQRGMICGFDVCFQFASHMFTSQKLDSIVSSSLVFCQHVGLVNTGAAFVATVQPPQSSYALPFWLDPTSSAIRCWGFRAQ